MTSIVWRRLDAPGHDACRLEVLSQRYERRTTDGHWCEAARFHYAALLEVTPEGFVRRYPGLWEAEA